jgi:opacity protein-like surface antigen
MNILLKGAVALCLTAASLGAAIAPAQAQYYGGHRDGWRGDNGRGHHRGDWRRDDRRWDNRRHWRGYRGGYHRPAYRQRCWNEWRYNRYYGQRVRVRICR